MRFGPGFGLAPAARPPGSAETLGRLMIGVAAFETGNAATTLLILRASQLFAAATSQYGRPGNICALLFRCR